MFFFNDTATTEIYTLSLHDALPIWPTSADRPGRIAGVNPSTVANLFRLVAIAEALSWIGLLAGVYVKRVDRKSTRLNSSHANISYAVFCLKKKKTVVNTRTRRFCAS